MIFTVLDHLMGRMFLNWHRISPNAVHARRPLNGPTTTMHFHLFQLAHAIAKTDAARRLPRWTIIRRTLGFLLEWGSIVSSSNGNIRLDVSEYVDFVGTSLTGRIGQGLGLLYCQSLGYTYLASYSSVFGQIPPESPKGKTPDFVLEKKSSQGVRALLEAKASTSVKTSPRRLLKPAVEQLERGFENASTYVSEGYATATMLRDLDNANDSEGFVVQISNSQPSSPPPDDDIVRHNYGAWLKFMGLTSLAGSLLRRIRHPSLPPMFVWVLEIEQSRRREIAVLPLLSAWWPPEMWLYPDPNLWYREFWRFFPDSWAIVVAGLDLMNLRLIATAARESKELLPDELRETEVKIQDYDQGVLSIFADTTVLGFLSLSVLRETRTEQI